MNYKDTIFIFLLLIIFASIIGCTHTNSPRKRFCDDFAIPESNKIYLLVSNNYASPEAVIEVVKSKTAYSLLRITDDVKVINSEDESSNDGFLLIIDVVNNVRSAFARRIDIRYSLIENKTKKVVYKGKDAVRSRKGYDGVARSLGVRTARRIGRILKCFNIRRNEQVE